MRTKTGRTLAVLAGLVAIGAIAWLATNVAREMQVLRSAQSDNAQWSLAQTEVEFLDFVNAVSNAKEDPANIRRRFDIFYSRIQTIEVARVYATLRENEGFGLFLNHARAYLDKAVTIVDLPNGDLMARQDELKALTNEARVTIRSLSNQGLSIFAINADTQRAAVAFTIAQLALALAVIIGALAFAIAYLNRLNAQNILRERAQSEIAARMNAIIETSLDGVIVSDAAGGIIEYNQAAESIFGFTRDEVTGTDITQMIKRLRLPFQTQTDTQKQTRHHIVGAGRLRTDGIHKDGTIFPLELSIETAQSNRNTIYIAFLRDVSSAVIAEQELVTARDAALAGEKLKTDFLTTMSHEIRTPLNGLLGSLSLIQDTELSPQQDRYIHSMETSGRLLMSHISDVLDITRYDAGRLPINIISMNLSILLQDIIDSQVAAAQTSQTTLSWDWLGPTRDWVLSDPDRVQLILMNLIGNAVKFTQGGAVKVTARVLTGGGFNDQVEVRVTDTGPGIAPNVLDHIFDDFVTGNPAYDREVGGTGLGLSIAKRFVTALGGSIDVYSTLGVGSTFYVILPMPKAAPQTSYETPAWQVKSQHQLSILLVEDNDINRIVATEMLRAAGHAVDEAHNGHIGVQMAAAKRFDLIFMDISMPVMDGRTATRNIRQGGGKSAKTPIVALTAHAMEEDQLAFERDGMVATLTKPLSKQGLFEIIRHTTQSRPFDRNADLFETTEFGNLTARFIAEIEKFLNWAKDDNPTCKNLAEQAHKMAGSAATFQTQNLAASLSALASMARLDEQEAIDAILADLPRIWSESKDALNAP